MRDKYNLLVKENTDGGDCAFDTGLFYSSCLYLWPNDLTILHEATIALDLLNSNNKYFRNPRPDVWWSWPTSMSRDQSVSLQCLMITAGFRKTHAAMLAAKPHALLHTNTEEEDHKQKFPDVVSPFELGLRIRSTRNWLLYPILWMLDLDILLNLLLFRWNKLWDHDAALINKLIATETVMPTPISKLTKYIYRFYDVEYRVQEYYNGTEPGHRLPEAAEVAILAYRKLIRKS